VNFYGVEQDMSMCIANEQPLLIPYNFGNTFSLVGENLGLFGGILSPDVG